MNKEIKLVGFDNQVRILTFEQFLASKRVGPGWNELLTEMCTKLYEAGWDGKLLDCKEKFGTLRFHIHPVPNDADLSNQLWTIVMDYEQRSKEFCELCGAFPARPRMERAWIKTLCYDCAVTDLKARLDLYKPNTHYKD